MALTRPAHLQALNRVCARCQSYFDEDRTWSFNAEEGTSIRLATLHEIKTSASDGYSNCHLCALILRHVNQCFARHKLPEDQIEDQTVAFKVNTPDDPESVYAYGFLQIQFLVKEQPYLSYPAGLIVSKCDRSEAGVYYA